MLIRRNTYVLIKVYDKPKLYNLETKSQYFDIFYINSYTFHMLHFDICILYIFYIFQYVLTYLFCKKYLHFRVN